MIGITASYINPMESENVYIALFLHQGLDIYLYCEYLVINDVTCDLHLMLAMRGPQRPRPRSVLVDVHVDVDVHRNELVIHFNVDVCHLPSPRRR